MSAPPPIDVPLAHPVPLLVRGSRGGRISFAEDLATTQVTIAGAEAAAFVPDLIHHGTFDRDVLRHAGRHWLPVTHAPETGPRPGQPRPMPLDLAVAALARGCRACRADPDDTTEGLAGPPFAALVNPSLRYTPGGEGLPSRIPPEAMETGLRLGRLAAGYAAADLVHDGHILYRAVDVPLLYPRVTVNTREHLWSALGEPGVLPQRIGPDNRFPHSPRGEGMASYGWVVGEFRRKVGDGLAGIAHGDADVVAFANEGAPGLVVLLRTLGTGEPGLRRLADGLWPLVAAGSVRAIRGDDLLPAVETLRAAAAAMNATPRHGRTSSILASFVDFADRVALPVLRERTPMPEADAESLAALTV